MFCWDQSVTAPLLPTSPQVSSTQRTLAVDAGRTDLQHYEGAQWVFPDPTMLQNWTIKPPANLSLSLVHFLVAGACRMIVHDLIHSVLVHFAQFLFHVGTTISGNQWHNGGYADPTRHITPTSSYFLSSPASCVPRLPRK